MSVTKITVVDYGAGNLLNVVRALEHLGAEVEVTKTPGPIALAQKLILPGVGAFADCMNALQAQGLVDPIKEFIASGRIFLGICVGMQVMFEAGEEFGEHQGLGIIPGRVVRIAAVGANGEPHKIPHIGWGTLLKPAHIDSWQDTILAACEHKPGAVYFVHSYAGMPTDSADTLARVDYNGIDICAMVKRGNAYGCQFHPEKSAETGLDILRNFLVA